MKLIRLPSLENSETVNRVSAGFLAEREKEREEAGIIVQTLARQYEAKFNCSYLNFYYPDLCFTETLVLNKFVTT
jgi:hypothetical protein